VVLAILHLFHHHKEIMVAVHPEALQIMDRAVVEEQAL
jgi:hypothetical protein